MLVSALCDRHGQHFRRRRKFPLSSFTSDINWSTDAERRIEQLDPTLFVLESQTSIKDRTSLLNLQRLIRRGSSAYCYFEIGSHLGGSLLPHLADPHCAWAISVDPRPQSQADERGHVAVYNENSTDRMIGGLRKFLPEENLEKLQTFDMDAAAVPRSEVHRSVQVALIDGEHTNTATFSDFMSILPLLADDALIIFHDSNLIAVAIQNIECFLTHQGIPFHSVFLPDVVAAIGLRGMAEPLMACVADVALERDDFIADAGQALQITVAMEVLERGGRGIPFRRAANYFLKRVATEGVFRTSRLSSRFKRHAGR